MEKIIIEELQDNSFKVTQGDKYAGKLTYEEMVGVVIGLTMPDERPCVYWMKTEEEHKDYRQWLKNHKTEEKF